jgi:hypothetical protein
VSGGNEEFPSQVCNFHGTEGEKVDKTINEEITMLNHQVLIKFDYVSQKGQGLHLSSHKLYKNFLIEPGACPETNDERGEVGAY